MEGTARGITMPRRAALRAGVALAAGMAGLNGALRGRSPGAVAAADYAGYTGFTTPEDPVLPADEGRPKLWFGMDDIPALLAKRDADPYAARLWQSIAASPYRAAPLPAAPDTDAKASDIGRYYGDMTRAAKYNAFLALVAGDDAARDTATQALLRAYDGPIYRLDPKRSGSPVDETYRAIWLQSSVQAYDWLRPLLSVGDDAAIRARLLNETRIVADNLDAWSPRPHNHLSKIAWALGSAALTFSDAPDAATWLRHALADANRNTRYFFSADGIYREGAHYFIYSWINFVPFLHHYVHASGVDLFPIYRPAFEWAVRVRDARGWMPNIEDAWFKPAPTHMVAARYRRTPTALHTAAPLAEVLQWHYFATDLGPWKGQSYTGASRDDTLDLDEYLTYDPAIPQTPPDAPPIQALAGGQIVFRDGWTGAGAPQRRLLFHGVPGADNHQHADRLSYVLSASGQQMASDAGYADEGYYDESRTNYYITPAAHNVVTADGAAPTDPAENTPPSTTNVLDSPVFACATKIAPYPDRAEKPDTYAAPGSGALARLIAFIGGDYFAVMDTLTDTRERAYDLYLHGGRGAMTGNGNARVWRYEADAYGGAAALAAWVFPASATFAEASGPVSYVKGDAAPYRYLRASQRGIGGRFLHLLVPRGADDPPPTVADLSTGTALAARIAGSDWEDTVLHAGDAAGEATAGMLSCSGRFAYARVQGGQLARCALVDGTALSYGGVRVAESGPTRITLALDLTDPARILGWVAPVAGQWLLTVRLPPGRSLDTATFNGTPTDATARGDAVDLPINGGGRLELRTTPR